MKGHRDDCDYWLDEREPLFASSPGSVERVSLGYDSHCDLIVVSGYYEGVEIPFDDFLSKLKSVRRVREETS